MLSFLHLCCLWSMFHTHTRQLGIPLSLGLSVLFFLHCPFQIEIIFVNRVVAIASLLLISGVLFPFASILAPRYSKLLTLSISSPSIAILASFFTFVNVHYFCFLYIKNGYRGDKSRYLATALDPIQNLSNTQSQTSPDQPSIFRPTANDRNLDLDLRQIVTDIALGLHNIDPASPLLHHQKKKVDLRGLDLDLHHHYRIN